MADIVDIGAAKLDQQTNALLVQAKSTQVGADTDDAPDMGDAPMVCGLGITAVPAPASEDGHAQGVKIDLAGTNGWIVGARDTRCAQVVAELGSGETCLHSTGKNFNSRVFCKDRLLAMNVGKKMTIVIDEKEKKITISAFGGHFEVSEADGVYMAHGGAMIGVKDGKCFHVGQQIFNNGTTPIMGGASPGPGVPIPGMFAG